MPPTQLVKDINALQPDEHAEQEEWDEAKNVKAARSEEVAKTELHTAGNPLTSQQLRQQLAKNAKQQLASGSSSGSGSAPPPPPNAAQKATKKQALHYGDTVTLRNVYNNYIIVNLAGFVRSGGYLGQNDRIRIVSPKGQSGIINYGDQVSLVGMNNRYFAMVKGSSGKVTCRTSKITSMSSFQIWGGDGPVMKEDHVSFKTAYGYVTATPGGLRGTAATVTALQKFFIGIPGKEKGLSARPGLSYGMLITMRNKFNEYLQADENGWVHVLPANGDWDKFAVLSPVHRTGLVSYGDAVLLKSHNGALMSSSPNSMYNLQTTEKVADEEAVFIIVGGTGVVHNDAKIALRSPHKGYIVAERGGQRATVAADGHYNSGHNFQLHFDLHQVGR